MLSKLAAIVTLVSLAVLLLQTPGVISLDAEVFKVVCVVGAVAAIVWAVTLL